MNKRKWIGAVVLTGLFASGVHAAQATSEESDTDGRAPLVGSVAVPPSTDASAELRDALRRVITEARDRVFPALVSIRVVTASYRGGREMKHPVTGSGTIITPEGHVLTNQHVTSNGIKFLCTLSDKREVSARLVGEDPLTDLAVLLLDAEGLKDGEAPVPVAPVGDSDALVVGDYVMAMGSPFSLSRSVSLGIVSNTERVFAAGFGSDDIDEMELEQGQRTGLFTRWIQHDALINPGNSGGPLVNLSGEVVGVNELGGNAMGFAIPANLSLQVAEALIAHGEVPRSWIGASFRPIRRTGLEDGVLIDSVVLGSPADTAGLKAGDVVVAIDDELVTVRFPEQIPLLLNAIASRPIGSAMAMTFRRDDEASTVRLETEKLTKDLGKQRAFHGWGLSGQEITPKMARDWRLEGTAGVLLTGVRSGGPAQIAEPSLAAGDVLLEVGGTPVHDLDAMLAVYDRLDQLPDDEEEPAPVLFVFDRRGKRHLTLLQPRSDSAEDPPRELPKAWLGIATQPLVPRLAAAMGLGERPGFLVTRVYPGTKAADADLAVGDVIVSLDGTALEPRGIQDSGMLQRQVRALDLDGSISLEVLRDGMPTTLTVPLERTRLAAEEARSHRDSDFELSVRELTFFDRDENRWAPDVRGVLVTQADLGGWAQLGGLRSGDLLQQIGGEPVVGLKSFRAAILAIKREQPERVEAVILRGVRTRFQFLEPDWTPAEEE